MPTEQILPLALSGAEIKKALQDKIAQLLNRDCRLNDNLAYGDGFYAKFSIELKYKDLGTENVTEIQHEMAMKADLKGEDKVIVPDDPREYESLNAVEAQFEANMKDPTAARIETGQEVPVRVTDGQGRDDVRSVKYGRDALKKSR